MTTVTHTTFLQGPFAPVREEVTALDLPVTGTLPPELNGRLVRIGPNPITDPDPATYHWFTGTGMVHGVRLRDGRAEWYRNRYVLDTEAAAALGRPPLPGERPEDGVVNTHVIGVGGRIFALVEAGSRPVELDGDLDSVARCDFGGTLDGSFSAHTHRDPASGDLHAVTYHWSWDHVRHVVVGPDARVRREARIPVPGGPMVHDCAITERWLLVFDLPVTFNMEAAAAGARLPYRWDPGHAPRVGLVPLDGDPANVEWYDAPACYVFHTLNAYDHTLDGTDGRVVVDVVRHPRMFATVTSGPAEGQPTLERWVIDRRAGVLRTEQLDDQGQEFPRIDERRTGRPHRYGYTAGMGAQLDHGPAYKHDLATGTCERHDYGRGRATMEPVFVPRHPESDRPGEEDDGWVLSTVYDAASGTSDVVVLHAQDFTGDPVATIHLPVRVPLGFHGSWIPD